jgi:hypothetical protein
MHLWPCKPYLICQHVISAPTLCWARCWGGAGRPACRPRSAGTAAAGGRRCAAAPPTHCPPSACTWLSGGTDLTTHGSKDQMLPQCCLVCIVPAHLQGMHSVERVCLQHTVLQLCLLCPDPAAEVPWPQPVLGAQRRRRRRPCCLAVLGRAAGGCCSLPAAGCS